MNQIARYVSHGSWWLSERVVLVALTMATQISIIRLLGTQYGELAYLLALTGLLTPLVYAGASGLVSKALVNNPQNQISVLRAALLWRLGGGLAAMILGIAIWAISIRSDSHGGIFLLLCLSQTALAFQLIEYHFHVALAPQALIPWRISGSVMGASAKILVAWYSRDVTAIVIVFAVDFLFQAVVLNTAYRRHTGKWLTPWPSDPLQLRWFATKSPWLIVSGLLEVLYLKIDIVMLEHYRGIEETGIYAAAARLSEAWYLIPTVLMAAWFPLIFAPDTSAGERAKRLRMTMDSLALIAISIAIVMQFAASGLVELVFGTNFSGSASILSLHIWASIFVFLRAVLSKWLIFEDLLSLSLLTHAAGALLNLLGNLVLIPNFGGQGAAVSTILAYAASTWLGLFVHPKTRPLARVMTASLLIPLRLPSVAKLLKALFRLNSRSTAAS